MDTQLTADIVVVGGGLSGLPFAIAAASAGLRIIVVDRERPSVMLEEPFDGRTSAIAYGSSQVLAGIGVWDLVAGEAEPILDIRVADQGSSLFLHYDHRDLGDEPLGFIVENRALRRALFQRLADLPDLVHLTPAAVDRVEATRAGVVAYLTDGRAIKARLAVAADGKNSRLREQAGIKPLGWHYPQHAITGTVIHEVPHSGVAVEHFLPAGPFAILPMTDDAEGRHRSSIVWTERATVAPAMMALDEAGFTAELADRFGPYLGAVAPAGPRWSYPLGVLYAERMVGERLALLGEAAHVIHPIAGQGLNLGIRDAAALAELVVDACRLGLDPGAATVLERYQRWRRVDTVTLAAVTDGLNRLFSNRVAPVKLVRDVGLALVDKAPPLKKLFMRHAMGVLGDLPRLVKGERL
ncbi:2-octaprenyl-3-methyl-6-methoxy-1,4-benzoquinol hydroxylase [Aliidongia dinghuensis]|uniref:2-octaprenyl-3-methyl-6-methoxy-1,4-benzoquinol hydroxylase n=1 Tax=Aliidongia dinghuensis TaxID=1867774 RepID=A0A8J2Z0A8_9PROT|nr:UbiH/UbiF/VisC/COQ6 family ubiquinone biosynthesis hydroxylase [Aliidongia dinghuensis]GGF49606.1 2-octaprenyl-3-methyl-6-methoxy-1,4-benzoquinol hydroxylase [Aliidongia dinghuensis]